LAGLKGWEFNLNFALKKPLAMSYETVDYFPHFLTKDGMNPDQR